MIRYAVPNRAVRRSPCYCGLGGRAAWRFGTPTSESHALIAGVSGAAIALHGGMDGINASEWIKVIYGLLLSTVLGFVMGWLTAKTVQYLCRGN